MGRPGKTARQNENRFYYVMRVFGITKADLGIVPHGLRHGVANDLYFDVTGECSPVRGGAGDGPMDHEARDAVSSLLGHGRRAVSNAYLGQSVVMRSKPQKGPPDVEVEVEPVEPEASSST
jgi:integrase